jgi:hypothetical protein
VKSRAKEPRSCFSFFSCAVGWGRGGSKALSARLRCPRHVLYCFLVGSWDMISMVSPVVRAYSQIFSRMSMDRRSSGELRAFFSVLLLRWHETPRILPLLESLKYLQIQYLLTRLNVRCLWVTLLDNKPNCRARAQLRSACQSWTAATASASHGIIFKRRVEDLWRIQELVVHRVVGICRHCAGC